MSKGKYLARAIISVPMGIWAEDKEDALKIAERVSLNLISRFGNGTGKILELTAQRKGSSEEEQK